MADRVPCVDAGADGRVAGAQLHQVERDDADERCAVGGRGELQAGVHVGPAVLPVAEGDALLRRAGSAGVAGAGAGRGGADERARARHRDLSHDLLRPVAHCVLLHSVARP